MTYYHDRRRDRAATLNEIGTGNFPGQRNEPGCHIQSTYWSLEEAAERCEKVTTGAARNELNSHGGWAGSDRFEKVMKLAREGWYGGEVQARSDVEAIVRTVENKYALAHRFEPVHDLSGGMVDIDAYLHGQPENMISYPPVQTTSAGRVISMAVSISSSAGVGPDAFYRRGLVVAALTLAMERQGMQTELWLDDSAGATHDYDFLSSNYGRTYTMTNRILIKSPGDSLDIAKVMFAFAHTGSLRHLAFGLMNGFPEEVQKWGLRGYPGQYGYALDCNQVLPPGSIYLPCALGNESPEDMLTEYLRQLGVLEEEEEAHS